TAHTLAATLGFLSLNPSIQEEIVAQVHEVTKVSPNGEIVSYCKSDVCHMPNHILRYSRIIADLTRFLQHSMKVSECSVGDLSPPCFKTEPFPASGLYLVREAKQDTVLNLSGTGEEPKILSVKKGTIVITDMIGVQYHTQYLSDPEEFKPARWHTDRTSDGDLADAEEYTAFSVGPRACPGKKFATTEAVCLLA
ncbi:hypothetical protein AZE42_13802, partial [Rhizopogon vesiculosus]